MRAELKILTRHGTCRVEAEMQGTGAQLQNWLNQLIAMIDHIEHTEEMEYKLELEKIEAKKK